MPKKQLFDVERERELLLQDVGGYEWALKDDRDEARSVGGLASTAHADLGTAIECILVGFDAPAIQLIEKSLSWLKEAIDRDEKPQRYAENGTEAQRFKDYALGRWLLDGTHDDESLQKFVQHEDRFLACSRLSRDKTEVSFILPDYVNARAYDRAIGIFSNTPGLSPPSSLRNLGSEARMSYVICQRRLERDYSDGEVADAARQFLTKNMDKWLGGGHAGRAAQWIKIIYGTNGDNDVPPRELLMKCYEHLPGCERIA